MLLGNTKQQKDPISSPHEAVQRSTHTYLHLVSVYKHLKVAKHLNTMWGTQLEVALLEQGLEQKTSRCSLQPQPFCDSMVRGIAFNKINAVS